MSYCFYLAGSSHEGEGLQPYIDLIKSRGWTISFDWTKHPSVKPYQEHLEEAHHFADKALAGARDCEIFVLFPGKEGGTTQFAELGAALFSPQVQSIFVVGEYNTRSLTFFHPRVTRVGSFAEIVSLLGQETNCRTGVV